MNVLPLDFGVPHAIAIALIFVLWGLYTQILGIIGHGSLNPQLHAVRLRWLQIGACMPLSPVTDVGDRILLAFARAISCHRWRRTGWLRMKVEHIPTGPDAIIPAG